MRKIIFMLFFATCLSNTSTANSFAEYSCSIKDSDLARIQEKEKKKEQLIKNEEKRARDKKEQARKDEKKNIENATKNRIKEEQKIDKELPQRIQDGLMKIEKEHSKKELKEKEKEISKQTNAIK